MGIIHIHSLYLRGKWKQKCGNTVGDNMGRLVRAEDQTLKTMHG
jgi:hypothetical protein